MFISPLLFTAFELQCYVSNLYWKLYKGEHVVISTALFLCVKLAANPISCRLDLRVGARREGADAEQQ